MLYDKALIDCFGLPIEDINWHSTNKLYWRDIVKKFVELKLAKFIPLLMEMRYQRRQYEIIEQTYREVYSPEYKDLIARYGLDKAMLMQISLQNIIKELPRNDKVEFRYLVDISNNRQRKHMNKLYKESRRVEKEEGNLVFNHDFIDVNNKKYWVGYFQIC